jgi:hypothetical protein
MSLNSKRRIVHTKYTREEIERAKDFKWDFSSVPAVEPKQYPFNGGRRLGGNAMQEETFDLRYIPRKERRGLL